MRILWIPHLAWDFIRFGQREHHIIEELKERHDFHVLTWEPMPRSVRAGVRSLRRSRHTEDGVVIHRQTRVPNVLGARALRSGRGLPLNERLFQAATRRIVERERIELVITGIANLAVGLPPADLPVPVVFDYLDYSLEDFPDVEREYFERSAAVICASEVLAERVGRVAKRSYYVSNGADLEALAAADPERVRREHQLHDRTVVSLIGVTVAAEPFFVDAMAAARERIPNLVFMLVGHNVHVPRILERAEQLGLPVIATGNVPRSVVSDYFAATDIGLNAVDQTPYFDVACPLKVLEYTGARKPVVATDAAELRRWNFPNVALVPPDPESFRDAIVRAATESFEFPDMSRFSWSALALEFEQAIEEVANSARNGSTNADRPAG